MKTRSLTLRIAVIVNAILITAAFVGCPARNNPTIVPTPIAPGPPHFVNIAPCPMENFQHLPPSDDTSVPPSEDSKNDKRRP
jgi:hypothetical protein